MLTKRMISTEIWEPRGLETYLAEMEAEGLRLVRATGWFLYFEKTAPRRMRYRVEYIRHPSEEQLALYADCGWEYVTETNREVQIFRAPEDADIPEIHTDGQIEANMYRHVNRTARTSFVMAGILVVMFTWFVGRFGMQVLSMPNLAWRVVVIGLLTLAAVCGAVMRYVSTRRYLHMLKRGHKVPASSRRYRLGIYAQYGVIAYLILYYVLLLTPVVQSVLEVAAYI